MAMENKSFFVCYLSVFTLNPQSIRQTYKTSYKKINPKTALQQNSLTTKHNPSIYIFTLTKPTYITQPIKTKTALKKQ